MTSNRISIKSWKWFFKKTIGNSRDEKYNWNEKFTRGTQEKKYRSWTYINRLCNRKTNKKKNKEKLTVPQCHRNVGHQRTVGVGRTGGRSGGRGGVREGERRRVE